MTRKRLLKSAIGLLVVAAVAYFFVRALRRQWSSLDEVSFTPGWWSVAAIVCFVAAVAVSGALWGSVVRRLEGKPLAVREGVRVHSASWLLKYVPGQVGFVVNKVMWGTRRGSSRTMILMSVVYENAFLLIGSLVPMLGIVMVAQAGLGEEQRAWLWSLAAIAPLAIVLAPTVFRRLVRLLARRIVSRDIPDGYFLDARTAWAYQGAYLAPRAINGVGVAVIAAAMVGAAPSTWVPLAAAYAIAGAVGIMAIFVPSGLGVREAVFVAFAAPFIGVEFAIVVSLASRVLATVADAGVGAIYGVLTSVGRRTHD